MRTHRGTKTTIDFENGELVEDIRFIDLRKVAVRDDLLRCRRFNPVPDTI